MAWSDVNEIAARKTDDFAWDTVWMEFRLASGGAFAINDEIQGFWALAETVKHRFPDSVQDWEKQVGPPPFARDWLCLYPRGGRGTRATRANR